MAGQYNYILTKNNTERNMEKFELENSREFKAAQEQERALNNYGWNEKRFTLATTTFHRTLQQTLFRTIVKILKVYAGPQRRTDLRNEASKEGAEKLMEVREELHIHSSEKRLKQTGIISEGESSKKKGGILFFCYQKFN